MRPAPVPSPETSWIKVDGIHSAFFDPSALLIVLAGTILATVIRVGGQDVAVAVRLASGLFRARFDEDANRTAVARWARAIRERGVLGAESPMPPDADLARAIKALVRNGSIQALRGAHAESSSHKLRDGSRAMRVFEQAGDLAPVFGLVGTLFSMTQLAPAGGADATSLSLAAIATAVLSTLYGVLAAHFLFMPLAQAVARRSQREDEARDALVGWLVDEIASVVPQASSSRVTPLHKVA